MNSPVTARAQCALGAVLNEHQRMFSEWCVMFWRADEGLVLTHWELTIGGLNYSHLFGYRLFFWILPNSSKCEVNWKSGASSSF